MKTAFIVQARMGSTRLPQKVLRPFYEGKCILELLISKLNQIKYKNYHCNLSEC